MKLTPTRIIGTLVFAPLLFIPATLPVAAVILIFLWTGSK